VSSGLSAFLIPRAGAPSVARTHKTNGASSQLNRSQSLQAPHAPPAFIDLDSD
jgi:hypothetical protein